MEPNNNQAIPDDLKKIYLKEMKNFSLLPIEKEKELLIQYKQYHNLQAREELINANLRLVWSIANKYKGNGVLLEDLIQEGNIGLITAVDKFSLNQNVKLATYAYWWIWQRIGNAISSQGKTIRLSRSMLDEIKLYKQAKENLAQSFDRTPTLQEIAEQIQKPLDQIKMYEVWNAPLESLNQMTDYFSDIELDQFFSHKENMENNVVDQIVVTELLSILSEKQECVIRLRYGLFGEDRHTLDEIAFILYKRGICDHIITKEGVRLLEKHALEKLKQEFMTGKHHKKNIVKKR